MISIILVAKNRETELKTIIDKIKLFPPKEQYEIVVVAPDTDIIKLPMDIRLVPITTTSNQLNYANARNVGALYAKYNWLVFLDVDLIPSRDTFFEIETVLKSAKPHQCFGAVRFQLSSGNYESSPLCGYCQIIHKKMFNKVNGYNETFIGHGGEDGDMHKRLELAGAQINMITKSVFLHKYHPPGKHTWKRTDDKTHTELPKGEFKMSGVYGNHILAVDQYRESLDKMEKTNRDMQATLEKSDNILKQMQAKTESVAAKEKDIEKKLEESYTLGYENGRKTIENELQETIKRNAEEMTKMEARHDHTLKMLHERQELINQLELTAIASRLPAKKDIEPVAIEPVVEVIKPWYKRIF